MFTFQSIQEITDGVWINHPKDRTVSLQKGAFDSRKIEDAEIFFAWKGENSDGHQYIDQLPGSSIKLVIVEKEVKLDAQIAVLKVPDTQQALAELAKFLTGEFRGKIVNITGSSGKTTAKSWLTHILQDNYNVLTNIGSFNNHIGCPITILNVNEKHDLIILEMGTSGLGELDLLSSIAPADISVLLNVGSAHLGEFGSKENTYRAKLEIFNHQKPSAISIIPFNDDKIKEGYPFKNYQYFGIGSPEYSWKTISIDPVTKKQQIQFQTPEGSKSIWVNQIGDYVGETLSALLAICYFLGLKWNDISGKLAILPQEKGRSTFVKGLNHVTLLDDVYNANPDSMINMLNTICQLDYKNCIGIVGNLAEMDEGLKESADFIVENIPDKLTGLLLNGETGKILAPLIQKKHKNIEVNYFGDLSEMIKAALPLCEENAVIGIKGSRSAHLERVLYALKGELVSCNLEKCGLLQMCHLCDQLKNDT